MYDGWPPERPPLRATASQSIRCIGQFEQFNDSKSYTFDIIKGKFEKGNYVEGVQEKTCRTVSFPDGFKYLGFYYKNKGLVYDEFDSHGNKTAQTISKKILEDKIDNSIFEKLLKD